MKIVIFGLTITSSWGNGHATTFRSLAGALALRQHQIAFIEKDVEWYRNNRDLPEPGFCIVHLYDDWQTSASSFVRLCADADVIVIGSFFPDAIAATTDLLHAGLGPILFYDIDTPITLAGLRTHGEVAYLKASLIPHYDAFLSFSGGPPLNELVDRFGARQALPFYCSVDPHLYMPTRFLPAFQCDLSYLGTYAKDRQPGLMRLLSQPAELLPSHNFLVAGALYPPETSWPSNVKRLTHVPPSEHPGFYSSARFTLNLTRADMAAAGYSPSVRLFEASACGSAILSDDWEGLSDFLSPGEQILLPRDAQDVKEILLNLPDAERLRIGRAARERILAHHTAKHRAIEFEQIVDSLGKPSLREAALPERASTQDREAGRSASARKDPGSRPQAAAAHTLP